MHFAQTLRYFQKNNARNIAYMAVLIVLENLDFEQIAQTSKCLFSDKLLVHRGKNNMCRILKTEYRYMELYYTGSHTCQDHFTCNHAWKEFFFPL